MKRWLMLQDYTALNTMYRMTLQKQTNFKSPRGNEKQIDFILTKRRYSRYNKDPKANDMIHIGSDHRCVIHYKYVEGKHDMIPCRPKPIRTISGFFWNYLADSNSNSSSQFFFLNDSNFWCVHSSITHNVAVHVLVLWLVCTHNSNVLASVTIHGDKYLHICETIVEGQRLL